MALLIKKLFQLQQGTTLIELLVYMGIFMGFFLIVSNLFASTLDLQRITSDTAQLDQEAQFIYSRLQYDLMRATAITQPLAGAQDAALQLTTASGTVRYYLNGTQLVLAEQSDTQALSGNTVAVSELNFQRLVTGTVNRSAVKVHLVLTSTYAGDGTPEQRVLDFTVGNQ